jgi:hypothetical protein
MREGGRPPVSRQRLAKSSDTFPAESLPVRATPVTLPPDASILQALMGLHTWRTTTKAVGFAFGNLRNANTVGQPLSGVCVYIRSFPASH